MRTQDEIVAKMRAPSGEPARLREVLIGYLDFEHAKEFLKPEAKREDWTASPATDDRAIAEMRDYAAFAWGKAEDHRGISASRSVDKLETWAWLLGRDEVVKASSEADYAQYGCPKLAIICEAFGFPIPSSDRVQNMIAGQPCTQGCDNGCGA